jgi:hypothetical protein
MFSFQEEEKSHNQSCIEIISSTFTFLTSFFYPSLVLLTSHQCEVFFILVLCCLPVCFLLKGIFALALIIHVHFLCLTQCFPSPQPFLCITDFSMFPVFSSYTEVMYFIIIHYLFLSPLVSSNSTNLDKS